MVLEHIILKTVNIIKDNGEIIYSMARVFNVLRMEIGMLEPGSTIKSMEKGRI